MGWPREQTHCLTVQYGIVRRYQRSRRVGVEIAGEKDRVAVVAYELEVAARTYKRGVTKKTGAGEVNFPIRGRLKGNRFAALAPHGRSAFAFCRPGHSLSHSLRFKFRGLIPRKQRPIIKIWEGSAPPVHGNRPVGDFTCRGGRTYQCTQRDAEDSQPNQQKAAAAKAN